MVTALQISKQQKAQRQQGASAATCMLNSYELYMTQWKIDEFMKLIRRKRGVESLTQGSLRSGINSCKLVTSDAYGQCVVK